MAKQITGLGDIIMQLMKISSNKVDRVIFLGSEVIINDFIITEQEITDIYGFRKYTIYISRNYIFA
jgi:hypothetical protein